MNLKKLTFFFIYTFLLVTFISLSLLALVLWEKDTLHGYGNSLLKDYASTYLPENYQLQSFDLQWSLKGILGGEGLHLKSTLSTPFGHFRLQGPIGFERKSLLNLLFKRHKDFHIQAKPEILFGARQSEIHKFADGTVQITIKDKSHEIKKINFQINFSHLPLLPLRSKNFVLNGESEFRNNKIVAQAKILGDRLSLDHPTNHISVDDFKVHLEYNDCHLSYHFSGNSIQYKSPDFIFNARPEVIGKTSSFCEIEDSESRFEADLFSSTIEIPNQNLTIALAKIHSSVTLNPFIPNKMTGLLTAQQLEVLWNEEYIDPQIEKYTTHFDVFNEPNEKSFLGLKKFNLQILQTHPNQKNKEVPKTILNFDVQGEDLLEPEVEKLILLQSEVAVSDIRPFLPPVTLAGWDIQGKIKAHARIGYSSRGADILSGTTLHFDNFQLQHNELRHLSRDISIKWRVHDNKNQTLDISMPSIRQLNLVASLGPWHLPISHKANQYVISDSPIPFRVQNLNFRLSPLKAMLRFGAQMEYSFETGLELEPVELKDLSQKICISPDLSPPGTLELTYPEFRLAHNHVYTKGEGLLNVFDGQIKITEFEIDKLLSETPTTFISASWKNLELARIGEFTNFGGMQGHASGYLHDVSFSGTLLKEYDFEFRLKPRPNESKFYFSRKATQNLVEIFAQGQGLSQGPANFILRLSSRLFGDYGISYAGLRAHTQRNFVVLETFDPPSVVQEQKGHFLLYGSRIKMPLSTQTYPVILSKSGWNGFVYYFRDSLLSLMNTPDTESQSPDSSESKEPHNPPPSPSATTLEIPCFDPNQEHRNSD